MNTPTKSEITVGGLRFTETNPDAMVRGQALCRYKQTRTAAILTFSAALIAQRPELADLKRVQVFTTDHKCPRIVLLPCGEDEGTAFLTDGKKQQTPRRKIQGRFLARLRAYAQIDFRLEPITEPRAGWLLTPTASQAKA